MNFSRRLTRNVGRSGRFAPVTPSVRIRRREAETLSLRLARLNPLPGFAGRRPVDASPPPKV